MKNAVKEDPLIQNLLAAKGKTVEAIAFGVAYIGRLAAVDLQLGCATIIDGEDQAVLYFERIESFRVLDIAHEPG